MKYEDVYGLIPRRLWGRIRELILDKHPRSKLLPRLHEYVLQLIQNNDHVIDNELCKLLYRTSVSSRYIHLKKRLLRIVFDYALLIGAGLESRDNGATSIRKINMLKGVLASRLAFYQGKSILESEILTDVKSNNAINGNNPIERLLIIDRELRNETIDVKAKSVLLSEYEKALHEYFEHAALDSAYQNCTLYKWRRNSSSREMKVALSRLSRALIEFSFDKAGTQGQLTYYKSKILYYGLVGDLSGVEQSLSELEGFAKKRGIHSEILYGITQTKANLLFSLSDYTGFMRLYEEVSELSAHHHYVYIRKRLVLLYLASLLALSKGDSLNSIFSRTIESIDGDLKRREEEVVTYLIGINQFLNSDFSACLKSMSSINLLFFESDDYKYGIRVIECLAFFALSEYDLYCSKLETLRKFKYTMPDSMANSKLYLKCFSVLKDLLKSWHVSRPMSMSSILIKLQQEAQNSFVANAVFPGGVSRYFLLCMSHRNFIRKE